MTMTTEQQQQQQQQDDADDDGINSYVTDYYYSYYGDPLTATTTTLTDDGDSSITVAAGGGGSAYVASISSSAIALSSSPSSSSSVLRIGFQNFGGLYDFRSSNSNNNSSLTSSSSAIDVRLRRFISHHKIHVFGIPQLNIDWDVCKRTMMMKMNNNSMNSNVTTKGDMPVNCGRVRSFEDRVRRWFNPATTRAVYSYNTTEGWLQMMSSSSSSSSSSSCGPCNAAAAAAASNSDDDKNNDPLDDNGGLQYGGTALICREMAALRFVRSTTDPRGLGRFVVQTFVGLQQHHHSKHVNNSQHKQSYLHVVMVHIPSSSSSSKNDTTTTEVGEDGTDETDRPRHHPPPSIYDQQMVELQRLHNNGNVDDEEQDVDEDLDLIETVEPRAQLLYDLQRLIRPWICSSKNSGGAPKDNDDDADNDDVHNNNNDDDEFEHECISSCGNDQVIVMVNGNDSVIPPNSDIYNLFTTQLGLQDMILTKHYYDDADNNDVGKDNTTTKNNSNKHVPPPPPPTSTAVDLDTPESTPLKPTDAIFGTPGIRIHRCGYTSFDGGVMVPTTSSNSSTALHRCLWADIDAASVFGSSSCGSGGDRDATNDSAELRNTNDTDDAAVGDLNNDAGAGAGGGGVVTPTNVVVGQQYWIRKQRDFERLVQVDDRIFRLKKYSKVFVGCEVVDAMVATGLVGNREDAVQLGKELQRRINGGKYFRHVFNDHEFEDEYYFYRFDKHDEPIPQTATVVVSTTDRVSSLTRSSSHDDGSTNDGRSDDGTDDHSNDDDPDGTTKSTDTSTMMDCHLLAKARSFIEHADVEDRNIRLRTYTDVFVGSEMVDSLLYYGITKTRSDAVELGQALQTEWNLFEYVPTGHAYKHPFKDEFYFYRFNNDVRNTIMGNNCGCGEAINDAAVAIATDENATSNKMDLKEKADSFRRLAIVRDRRYHFRLYKDVFVGCEVVDKMVDTGLASSRAEAVQLGRQLEKEMSLFRHVVSEHKFADEYYFYVFSRNDRTRMTLKQKMRSMRNV